jgi:GTPase
VFNLFLSFIVQIKSIHSKRTPVQSLSDGYSAGFALKKIKRSAIRKGMVMAELKSNPIATWIFEADVAVYIFIIKGAGNSRLLSSIRKIFGYVMYN